jgi:hypothetical protein
MAKLITIYWRDSPAQVAGRRGRTTAYKQLLDPRFQRAIDRAAMRGGRGSSAAYLDDWRRESRPCDGDLGQAVNDEASRLESESPPDVLETVVRAKGLLKKSEA